MKRVLITGAGGFVGANLARLLLPEGHEVHLLVRPDGSSWRLDEIRDQAAIWAVDLTDEAAVLSLVHRVRPEWIFHLAAHGVYSWQTDAARMLRTEVLGTLHLLQACLQGGFEGFVHASSSSEYGPKDHAPAESEALAPTSVYGVAKAAATLLCQQAAEAHGLRVRTLRLYSVYGPYEEPARLVPKILVKGLEGELPPLVHPKVAHDFVYVQDVCDALRKAVAEPGSEKGGIYNIGTGIQTTMEEVVECARRVLGIAAEPRWGAMPERAWDTRVWVCDRRKAERDLRWKPTCGFEEGLRRMRGWLLERPERLSLYRERGGH